MTDKQIDRRIAGGGSPVVVLTAVGSPLVVLPEASAGDFEALQAVFAHHMGEGLMAASVP